VIALTLLIAGKSRFSRRSTAWLCAALGSVHWSGRILLQPLPISEAYRVDLCISAGRIRQL